ncbi:uncharacterized protein EAE98_009115 [Botrytis deweyae]|uniref:Uncharacterized protein n=1 Tax=Botrytis deweyae TaxID=2478750 RepID=A0ABQ7IC59_9HELO|nr:uncharacterized protein EAE98_009115 [Botrytis deweyae]KAF7919881.1 hypothetical protein EAE98_009115 [Botrytis deweyae]
MGFQIDALLVRIKVRQAGVENNDDARYQEMSLKLLEALEGGARSAGQQTLSFQEKPVTEGLQVDAAVVLDFMFIMFVCKYRT